MIVVGMLVMIVVVMVFVPVSFTTANDIATAAAATHPLPRLALDVHDQ